MSRRSNNIFDENPDRDIRRRQFSMLMCCKTQSKSVPSSAGEAGIAMGRFAVFGAGGRMVFDSGQWCDAA